MKKITKRYAVRLFVNTVLGQQIIIPREKYEGNNMGMGIWDKKPRLKLPNTLDRKLDAIDKEFRKDFVNRCPLARGFSTMTLALLHECGHWKTRDVCNMIVYGQQVEKVTNQHDYMLIPYEHLATDWAIAWLQNPDNRRLAKFFERLFFQYGNDIEQ